MADWQQHYNDYCIDNFGGREVFGREHDEAAAYADEMMEEEEYQQDPMTGEVKLLPSKPRCAKCNGTGWWVETTFNSISGGPCDCPAGLRAMPLVRL